MSLSSDTMQKIKKWSEKTGIPSDELVKRILKKKQELMQYSKVDEATAERRARFLVYSELKRELISPAKWFEGVILGYSEAWDITEPIRRQILAEYEANPERAIAEGKVVVDEQGNVVPVDTRPTLPSGQPNPFYGKPIQPMLIRNIVGVVKPVGQGEFKLTVMVARFDQTSNLPPLGNYVKFRALPAEETDTLRVLRTSRVTRYIETEGDLGKPIDILRGAPDIFKCGLKELDKCHDEKANWRFPLVIIEGDVLSIGEQTSRGNRLVLLEDETFDLEDAPVPVWVHSDILHLLNFEPGARVAVIGTVVMMPDIRDRSRQRPAVNAWGIYPDESLR